MKQTLTALAALLFTISTGTAIVVLLMSIAGYSFTFDQYTSTFVLFCFGDMMGAMVSVAAKEEN